MPFREVLRDIVEGFEGGLGAIIMGYDGISIDEYLKERPGLDLHILAVEYSSVMKEIKRTVDVLKNGEMEEVSISTDKTRVVSRVVNDDIFVVLTLEREGNYGKGRYLLKREIPKLRELLS